MMQDKVVVITGAARGFGRAIAERMGRDGTASSRGTSPRMRTSRPRTSNAWT